MTDVFISYSNDGKAIAAGRLEANGRKVGWDTNPFVPRSAAYRVGLIGLVVLGLVGSTAAAQTSDRSWVLEKGQGFKSPTDSPASLTLNDKELSGSTGCNTFRATLSERAEKRVAINDVALTRKLCAPPASVQQDRIHRGKGSHADVSFWVSRAAARVEAGEAKWFGQGGHGATFACLRPASRY